MAKTWPLLTDGQVAETKGLKAETAPVALTDGL